MARITITIKGTKETSKTLKKISADLRNPIEPLSRSSRNYLNAISANFRDEGKTFGLAWPPLSPATIAIKTQLKKQGEAIAIKKPLVRTGALRRSFGYDLTGKNQSSIYSGVDYAIVHQEGGSVFYRGRQRKVPKRTLAEVDAKRIQMVGRTFETWIHGLIKKYKAA